jgi:hypothetical protein
MKFDTQWPLMQGPLRHYAVPVLRTYTNQAFYRKTLLLFVSNSIQ